MDAAERTEGNIAGLKTTAKNSELERLASALGKQRELIRALESKLDVVSNRPPSPDNSAPPTDRVHISTLVDFLAENNREIVRLHDELAL